MRKRGAGEEPDAWHAANEQRAPGSDAALAMGCRCPVLDNAHGLGYMGVAGRYVINAECALHAQGGKEDGQR